MGEDNRQTAFNQLLLLAKQQDYLTYDDIDSIADKYMLSISEIDWLSNSIVGNGIIIQEEKKISSVYSRKIEDDNDYDYAQVNYELIFDKVVEIEPSLEPFISEVRRIKPAKYKEFSQLIFQAKEGNAYARKRILEMNLRIAVRIALQRAEQFDIDIIDCLGDACVGLIMALEKYNPELNGPFGTYAGYWIFQNVSREQKTQRPLVYYPVHKKDQFFAVYPFLRDRGCVGCEKVLFCKDVRAKIKNLVDCKEEQVEDIILQLSPIMSIEEIIDKTSSVENEMFDNYFYKAYNSMNRELSFFHIDNNILDTQIIAETVQKMMAILSQREKEVIKLKYGLEDGIERTLEEVGRILGVTRERIRQIETKALKKMRSPHNLVIYTSLFHN